MRQIEHHFFNRTSTHCEVVSCLLTVSEYPAPVPAEQVGGCGESFDLRLFQNPSEYDYRQADEVFSHRIDHQATLGLVGGGASDELTLLSDLVDE